MVILQGTNRSKMSEETNFQGDKEWIRCVVSAFASCVFPELVSYKAFLRLNTGWKCPLEKLVIMKTTLALLVLKGNVCHIKMCLKMPRNPCWLAPSSRVP